MAFRAIALAEGLSGDAKRVAAIILGHFNTKTGQCDPGTERLMSKANVSKRTVVNATNELHRLGLVVKVRHGGNGFRSRYQPKWSRFREIVEASERDDDEPEKVQNGALRQCKMVHLDSANPCTLTHVRNSSKKLIGTDGASGRVQLPKQARADKAVGAERVNGLLRRSVRGPLRQQRQPLSVVDAQEAARQQLDQAIAALGETMKAIVLGRITPEIEQAALVAEQKSRGAGLRLVVDRVSDIAGASRRGGG
jgi:predicted transcriptional regulator